MQSKISGNRLFIVFTCFFLTACIGPAKKNPLPNDEQAIIYFQMGVRYLGMNMLEIAKDNLELAVSLDPDNSNIHSGLGALYERLRMFPEAKDEYEIAINLDDSDFGAKNNYGHFLCEREGYDEGLKYLNEALLQPLNDRKWFAYTNVGLCELSKGNMEEAEFNFRNALQMNKSYSPALFEMQKISYHSEKYMSARAFLERYLAVAEHNAQTLWYAVQTERALGDKAAADSYQEKLFSLFPASKQAMQLRIKK